MKFPSVKAEQRPFVVYHMFHVIGVHQTFLSVVIAIDSIHGTGDELHHRNVCTGSMVAGGNCDSGFLFFSKTLSYLFARYQCTAKYGTGK